MNWKNKNVVVTGGASFIGSHLVDKLVKLGAKVTVIDNLSSGKLENLAETAGKIKFVKKDLEYARLDELVKLFGDNEIVFHLAAVHGGRGYIATHPADICSNLAIDHHVFEASCKTSIERIVYASTACVYPPNLQNVYDSDYLIREEDCDISDISKPLSADLEYGWGKLMGEIQLLAYIKQYGMKGCSLRFVTAYGPRENETHSIVALIYKAFQRMEPLVIWGTGEQDRDFTFVSDIANGTIVAAEKIKDGSAVNLGTGKRYKIKDVAAMIFDSVGFHPKSIVYDASKPVGVLSRALDITKARKLGWGPKVSIEEGIKKTAEWYARTHTKTGRINEQILTER